MTRFPQANYEILRARKGTQNDRRETALVPPIAHSGISAGFWSAKDQDAIALGLPKRI